MAMDLRCPKCGSARINAYETSPSIGWGFRSIYSRYVCEDCGYVGALILDVSENEDKNKNPVESDLKEIKKEMGDLYNKSIRDAYRKRSCSCLEIHG
ncbi:MAG: hypothetical protein CVT89_01310 [Candidatus Altiarchaeales archaeon HGW-Altiarchaeales-2]|nr:MAG: hypothetical protein CVT89_01310 [Candidatus Altiarchaeales archaeon HGW-Altiarchaeales-2]